MSFERIKTIKGRQYLYEQESERKDGKINSRHVRYIGKVGTTNNYYVLNSKTGVRNDFPTREEADDFATSVKERNNLDYTPDVHKSEVENNTSKVEIHKNKFHTIHKSHESKPFDKEYVNFELNRHMIITIPSTQGQKHVSQKEIDKRARDVATNMTDKFGGSTRIKGQGQYENKRYHKIDDENIVKVEVFMTKKQWTKEKPKIEKYLGQKQKLWKQEDLAVEFDKSETMYFIRQPKLK